MIAMGRAPVVSAMSLRDEGVRRCGGRLEVMLEDRAQEVAPALEKLAQTARSPLVRMQALSTLEGLGVLKEGELIAARGKTNALTNEKSMNRWLAAKRLMLRARLTVGRVQ